MTPTPKSASPIRDALLGLAVLCALYGLFSLPVLMLEDAFHAAAPVGYFAATLVVSLSLVSVGLLVVGLLRAVGEDARALLAFLRRSIANNSGLAPSTEAPAERKDSTLCTPSPSE